MSIYDLSDEDKDALQHWNALASKYPLLKDEEKVLLIRRFQAGEVRVGDKLLNHNLRLVMSIAKKHCGRGVPLADLMVEGSTGFLRGLRTYDETRGYKVSTYVTWWVRQAITRAIENLGKLVRIPSHKQQMANKVKYANKLWVQKQAAAGKAETEKSNPSAADLKEFLPKLSIEEIEECKRYLQDHVSLNQLVGTKNSTGEEDTQTLENYLEADYSNQPEELVEGSTDSSYLMECLQELSEDDRSFIIYKFGYLDGMERTKKEMQRLTGQPAAVNQARETEILDKLKCIIDLKKLSSGASYENV